MPRADGTHVAFDADWRRFEQWVMEHVLVASDSTDSNAIWITEAWDSVDSHQASLALPAVQQAIGRGRPLIAGFGERFVTTPVGGVGLRG